MKFGGTSVANIERIKTSQILLKIKKIITKLVVVVSAMAGVTNDLVQKSKDISNDFSNEEYDVLLSSENKLPQHFYLLVF